MIAQKTALRLGRFRLNARFLLERKPRSTEFGIVRTQRGHSPGFVEVKLLEPACLLAAPQGFEPRYADPETARLALYVTHFV
jgi:hypothetical protein